MYSALRRTGLHRVHTAPAALVLILTATLFLGCSGEQTYEVRGRVAGFGTDPTTLVVEHEDIPGLMPAMTMPFQAADTNTVAALSLGDAIAFRLIVTDQTSRVEDITILPDDALPAHPAGTADQYRPTAEPLLEVGDPVPDTEMLTHADTSLTLPQLRGQRVLLTFIYVRCPVPDFCPLMSQQFAALQPRLSDIPGPPVHLLSISFDPANDTPAVLRDYSTRYTDDTDTWTFATGNPEALRDLANRFGVFYTGDGDQIIHNLVTVLVDETGTIQHIWRGNDWRPEDVLTVLDIEPNGT